jgi:signal transduction histidine kinase
MTVLTDPADVKAGDASRTEPLRLLIVEDSEEDAALVVHLLRQSGYATTFEQVAGGGELRDALANGAWDVVISDYDLPGYSGLQALADVSAVSPNVPFIILSGKIDPDTAVEAMRKGARDFIMKADTRRLVPVVRRELREAKVRSERASMARAAEDLRCKLAVEKMTVEALRELDRAKDRFVEVVSHELRTPMAPLRSAIDLLLDEVPGPLSAKQRDLLHLMQRNVERLARVATDILSLSRIQTGNQAVNPRVVVLADSVLPAADLLRGRALQEGKAIEADIPSGLSAFADPDALAQVVTNLVNNAIAHTPAGTVIRLSARAAGDAIALAVIDNGQGLPPEAMRKLFTPFYQVNRRTGPGYNGMGLGLAICKGLVDRMGGRIEVSSQVGRGCAFTVTLPATAEARGAASGAETREGGGR